VHPRAPGAPAPDHEIEQRSPRGEIRPGQCQNVMAQPPRERPDVAGKAGRLGLSPPRELQLDGKLVVLVTQARAADPVLQLLAS
jgi:hypothetical protein